MWSTDASYLHLIKREVDVRTGEFFLWCASPECLAPTRTPCWACKRVVTMLARQ